MARRLPASMRTREELRSLIEGRLAATPDRASAARNAGGEKTAEGSDLLAAAVRHKGINPTGMTPSHAAGFAGCTVERIAGN